jgi:hypothetical protein
MKKQIKIYFTDIWQRYNPEKNYFIDLLRTKYDVLLDNENPDFILYSCWGADFLNYNCPRVFFSAESIRPDFDNCDWAFTSDFCSKKVDGIERHFRFPVYMYMTENVAEITLPKPKIEEIIAKKTKFCNFVYSNPSCKMRNDFFHKLSKYKKVDSAGRHLNNMNAFLSDKIKFLEDYKFTIAFENSEFDGYTTEKLYEPFVANSLPIYWGNPLVHKDFSTKSFLNFYDFPNVEALIERIIEIDNNDDLLAKYLVEPAFAGNQFNEFVKPENVLAQFDKIINTKISPISLKNNTTFKKKIKRLEHKKFWLALRIKNFRLAKIKIKLRRMKEKRQNFVQKN